jgi:hypothetical protein
MREALGLGTQGPLILSGHQPQIWHAGVLAKYIAAGVCARHAGGQAAWLVVDTDEVDPGAFWYPAPSPDGAARRVEVSLGTGHGPACGRGVMTSPRGLPDPTPEYESRVVHLIETLLRESDKATNAAEQVVRAYAPLVQEFIPALPLVFASSLNAMPLFEELVSLMAADPRACIEAYNQAAAAVPQARIRPLEPDELPLWRLEPGARHPVRAGELSPREITTLAPRALLLTALVRMGLCDLFIHGTGGEVYERVTDRWIGAWLGPEVRLAPSVMMTATLLPDLPPRVAPPTRQINQVRQRERALRFDPSLVGDRAAVAKKAALLAEIQRLPRHSPERRAAFAELHTLLAAVRAEHAPTIDRLRAHAASIAAGLATDPAADRTLPFPLHAPEALRALVRDVEALFISPD